MPLQVAEKETLSLYRLVNMHILMNTHDNIAQFGEDRYKEKFKDCISKLLHTYGRLQSHKIVISVVHLQIFSFSSYRIKVCF